LGEVAAAADLGASWDRRAAFVAGALPDVIHLRFEERNMEGWTGEVRYAIRGLLRRPGFALVTALTLGLGIGANTAIFSVVNGVVLQPLPYERPDALVQISSAFPTMGFEEFWISPPEFFELGERARSFEALGGYRHGQANVGGGDQPERVASTIATAGLFRVLGVPPQLGRVFTDQEDLPGGDPVVVLGHGLWQRSFGGDRDIVGRGIEVNGVSRTVVGVMPPGFDLEDAGIELWIPAGLDPTNRQNRGSHFLRVVGRLAPGVTLERASTELGELVARWPELNPGTHTPSPEGHPMSLVSLQEEVVGDVRGALLLLLGAVGFVLLIACANVANLLLARAEDRQKEVAVRVAMGAGRGRLIRQFLAEGVLLSLVGAAVGLGVAWMSLEALRALTPGDIPRLGEVGLDGAVLGFTMGIALLTGIFFGLAPARHLSGAAVGGSLRDGGQRSTSALGRTRLRSLLVVSEVALALVLATGSGLMIRSFQELNRVDPGFDPDQVLTFQLSLPAGGYPGGAEIVAFHTRLADELAGLPGVRSVAAMSGLPPQRDLNANDTEFDGVERTRDGPPHNVDFYQTVTTAYLETMDIDVVEGRGFQASDGPDGVPVALVNETLARLFYAGESPIGRRLRPCCGDQVPWLEIVGVVADVKQAGLHEPAGTELYFHLPQAAALGGAPRTMNLVARTAGAPEGLAAPAREAVGRLDRSLPVSGLRTMDQVLSASTARPRFLTLLLGVFAALALTLAAVGTYGVMAYSVAQRSREIGIRMALGAERGRVQALVLRQGLVLAAAGLVLGTIGAVALAGLMRSLLFEVDARDPATFVVAPLLLATVALLACWIPARRATRVDPVTVLRED
jgi:putative ABC transport system permease protein